MEAAWPQNSTTVRSPRAAPRTLRLALAASTAVAPALASYVGERLFLRPPRRRATPSDLAALAAGEPFAFASGGETIRAWRFGAGPAVLLVHGWGGAAAQVAPLVAPLVEAGCSAVAFDGPAHGASTGRLASGVALAGALSALAARVGARAAVGHSLGASALGWALAEGLALDAAVLVSPPRSVGAYFRRFSDALALPATLEEAIRARLRRRYGVAPEDFDLCRRTGDGSTPVLVVHDRDDREVPWADGEAVARAWPRATLSTTSGLGHRGVLRDAGVGASVASFVRDHLAQCGCGRLAVEDRADIGPVCETCALDRDLYDRGARRGAASEAP
jgi:pimeloyl-ACP methyl ester carboxylesterase